MCSPNRGCAGSTAGLRLCLLIFCRTHAPPTPRRTRLTQSGKAAQNHHAGSLNLREAQLPLPGGAGPLFFRPPVFQT